MIRTETVNYSESNAKVVGTLKWNPQPVISKMYFSHREPPEVSERMWSVNIDVSISGEYQTLGGHSGRLAE